MGVGPWDGNVFNASLVAAVVPQVEAGSGWTCDLDPAEILARCVHPDPLEVGRPGRFG